MNSAIYYENDSPVLFNLWKHHLGFINNKITEVKSESELKTVEMNLLKIGESQMDLYTGNLSPENILMQINEFIVTNNLNAIENYKSWLYSDCRKGYSQVTISDTSNWTFRLGNDEINYVHIHPSRYSPNTIRIKATILKTGIILFSFLNFNKGSYIDINLVNKLRNQFLNESPVKTIDIKKGLGKFLDLLHNQIELKTKLL